MIGNEAESPGKDPNFIGVTTPSQTPAPPPGLAFEDRGVENDEDEDEVLATITAEMGVSPVMVGGEVLEDIAPPQDGVEGVEGESVPQSLGGENDKYVCPTCNKVFDRPYRYQRHLQIHNPNRTKVVCQLCDKTFTRMDTLENHMKCLHSNDRPFKCTFPDCPKRFPLQSALIHHLKVRAGGVLRGVFVEGGRMDSL